MKFSMAKAMRWTLAFLLFVVAGCQTMRVPFTGPSFEDHERQLVGRHYPEANRVLGPHFPVWKDSSNGERYLRYPVPGGSDDEFYLARVSDRDVIVALSRWRASGRDWDATDTIPGTKTPLLGTSRSDDRPEIGLAVASLTFHEVAAPGPAIDVHPADKNLFGRNQMLMVECDEQGIRRRARFFAVEGEIPAPGKLTRAAPPKRPTLAARVDLFGESKPSHEVKEEK